MWYELTNASPCALRPQVLDLDEVIAKVTTNSLEPSQEAVCRSLEVSHVCKLSGKLLNKRNKTTVERAFNLAEEKFSCDS